MTFVEKVIANAKTDKDFIILSDETNPKGVTFEQFDILSGKVYSYLKKKGVGKEDFVLICLPRGIQPIITLFGVLRAGAAFVIVEDNYAPERIAFIKKDSNAKIVIDKEAFEDIQDEEYLSGFEKANEHDAAFAVYTSGTTGNPKGVLHEYGNLDRMIDSTTMRDFPPIATREDRFALVAPLNFVASMLIIVYGLYYVVRDYVVAYSTIKNTMAIGLFIIKNKITGTFLTPSYIRKIHSKPPMLKWCLIGSEPANGVYLEGLMIHNFYLMSESGFAVCIFHIDKRYEETPVGKSAFGHDILLLDDSGKKVEGVGEGEICFENKYVRGYLNLPDETAKAFRDGLYHTGDLAKRLPDGNLVIVGRLSDMVKINGNRVEPVEIETVAKKVLKVNWAGARVFDDGNRVFICVYYTDKITVDTKAVQDAMSEYLPYYMIPSYFIKIDNVPLKPNGKMDRKALPKPNVEDYQGAYVAPVNDLQKSLCDAFAKVLQLKRVGIKDDFYELGGDSLASMEVLAESKIKGLTTADIFAAHTPEAIAERYKKEHPQGVTETDEERDERARSVPHPLTPFQTYMVDYQFYTPISTMLNLFTMLRFDLSTFEPEKMRDALTTVIKNHPSLLTRIYFDKDGELKQQYWPDYLVDIAIEKISDEELEAKKRELSRPFKVIDKRLYRIRLYVTPSAGYIFFDVHHTVFDGTSFKVLIGDIVKAYYGTPLDRDYYYRDLATQEEIAQSDAYLEAKKYFEDIYDGDDYVHLPKIDHEVRENKLGHLIAPLASHEQDMEAIEKRYGVSRNAFFSLTTLLAIALYNRKPNIEFSWTYNGREDLQKLAETGLLLKDLPLALRLKKKDTIKDLYANMQEQINQGIAHSCYPYTLINATAVKDDSVCFLYQQDIRDGGDLEQLNVEMVDVQQNKAASENALDVQILDGKDGLTLVLDYAASLYDEKSIARFRDIFLAVASSLYELGDDEKATIGKLIHKAEKKIHENTFFLTWIKAK